MCSFLFPERRETKRVKLRDDFYVNNFGKISRQLLYSLIPLPYIHLNGKITTTAIKPVLPIP